MGMSGKYHWNQWGILFISLAITVILALLFFNKAGGAANLFNSFVYLSLIISVVAFCTNKQIPIISIENDKLIARKRSFLHDKCVTVDSAQKIITIKSGLIFVYVRVQSIHFYDIESISRSYSENHEAGPSIYYTVSLNLINPVRGIELFDFSSTKTESSSISSRRYLNELMEFTGKECRC